MHEGDVQLAILALVQRAPLVLANLAGVVAMEGTPPWGAEVEEILDETLAQASASPVGDAQLRTINCFAIVIQVRRIALHGCPPNKHLRRAHTSSLCEQ